MKTRHMALFGLDVSSGEDDVTNPEREFSSYLFLHFAIRPSTSVELLSRSYCVYFSWDIFRPREMHIWTISS